MKKHLITTIFFGYLYFFVPLIVQAASLEISQTIWSVKQLTGENLSESKIRKIGFSTNHEFKLLVGCEYYRGRYQAEDNKLRISTLIKVTEDCGDEKQNDAAFLHALLNVEAYELTEESLRLTKGNGEIVAILESAAPFDLPAKKANKKSAKHKKTGKKRSKLKDKKAVGQPQNKAQTSAGKTVKKAKSSKAKATKSKKSI